MKKVRKELYVDDLISGSITVGMAKEVKDKATVVFREACFSLHKWHSNAPELEADHSSAEYIEEATFAKQHWARHEETYQEYSVSLGTRHETQYASQSNKRRRQNEAP